MKKDVYISIKGSQDYGDDKNGMELTTAGTFTIRMENTT